MSRLFGTVSRGVNTIVPKIKELFGIDEVEITKDCIEQ